MRRFDAKLLIVYNADSGFAIAVLHTFHKTLRRATYPCSLCALTHGLLTMHRKWRSFLTALPLEIVFHHRDDFAEAYPGNGAVLPAILLQEGDGAPKIMISAEELDQTSDLDALIAMVESRLVDRVGARVMHA